MKYTVLIAMVLGLSVLASAEEFTGFVADQNCAGKPTMKADAACAERCIKRGTAAVLWTDDDKVIKIENQDKITAFAGKKVTVTGKMNGGKLQIESVK